MVMVSLERYNNFNISAKGVPPRPTVCATARSLALLVTFAMLFNLPKIWEFETCRQIVPLNSTDFRVQLRLQFSKLYRNQIYRGSYLMGANILVHWVIPLISLVYLNVGIYRGVSSKTFEIEEK